MAWDFSQLNQRILFEGSSNIRATKAFLYYIKEAMVNSSWGTVAASSTGTSGSWGYSDLWTANYDSVLSTRAWVVITSVYGQEICLQVTSDISYDRYGYILSPGGNFVYGGATATVRPTATDEIVNGEHSTTDTYNSIYDGDLTLYRNFHAWVDTTGKNFMAFIGRPNSPYKCGNFFACWYMENRVAGDTDPWCLAKIYGYMNLNSFGWRYQPGIASTFGQMRVEHPSAGDTRASLLMPRIVIKTSTYCFPVDMYAWDRYTVNNFPVFPFLVFTTSNYRYCGEITSIKLAPRMFYHKEEPFGNVLLKNRQYVKFENIILPWDGSSDIL